jgi:hypothetical protein
MSQPGVRFEVLLHGVVDDAGRLRLIRHLRTATRADVGTSEAPPEIGAPIDYTESIWRLPHGRTPAQNKEYRLRLVHNSTAVAEFRRATQTTVESSDPRHARVELFVYQDEKDIAAKHPGVDVRIVSGCPLVAGDARAADSGHSLSPTLEPAPNPVHLEAERFLTALGREKAGTFRVVGEEFLHHIAIGSPPGPDQVFETDTVLVAVSITQTCHPETGSALSPGFWLVELLACAPLGGETSDRVASALASFGEDLSPMVVLQATQR